MPRVAVEVVRELYYNMWFDIPAGLDEARELEAVEQKVEGRLAVTPVAFKKNRVIAYHIMEHK